MTITYVVKAFTTSMLTILLAVTVALGGHYERQEQNDPNEEQPVTFTNADHAKQPTESTDAESILRRLQTAFESRFESRITDVQCDVWAIIRPVLQPHSPVLLHLLYIAKPPNNAKLILMGRIASDKSLDFFRDKVGMVYATSGTLVWSYEPFSERTLVYQMDKIPPSEEPISRILGSGDIAPIQPYVKALILMTHPQNIKESIIVSKQVKGKTRVVNVKVRFKQPISPVIGHTVHSMTLLIDMDRNVILEMTGYDDAGKQVTKTTFSEVVPVGDYWMPLKSITEIEGGEVKGRLEAWRTMQDGTKERITIDVRLPISKRILHRRFFVHEEKLVLLRDSILLDEKGRPLIHILFRNYRLNRGLPDALFRPAPAW